jgi:hypothetical protein
MSSLRYCEYQLEMHEDTTLITVSVHDILQSGRLQCDLLVIKPDSFVCARVLTEPLFSNNALWSLIMDT